MVSQRTQIRTKNKESFEYIVLKQKQHRVPVAVAVEAKFRKLTKGQFPVNGIFRAGGILDNKRLPSRNYLLNFRAALSLASNRNSTPSENSTHWKSALMC